MYKTLLGAKLGSLKYSLTGGSKSRKKQSAGKIVLYGILFLYVAACFLILMFGMFVSMAKPFYEAGLSWTYFAMYAVMDMSLMVVFSVFMAKSMLYEAKDNELLMALPIRPGAILASRMSTLLIINMVCGLLVTAPVGAAWLVAGNPVTALQIVIFVVIALLIPFFSLALSSLLAWVISLLTSRVRRKTLMDTVFMLVFFAAYFYACSQLNGIIASLATSGGALAGSLGAVAPVVWIGRGIADGNLLYFLYSVLILAVPFALVYWILAKTFIKTATMKRGFAKVRYVDKGQKVSSLKKALYHKELARFTSSSAYMINAGLGMVFMVVAAGFLFIKGGMVRDLVEMMGMGDAVFILLALVMCLLQSMTLITSASISLEGSSLWVLKSAPVGAYDILKGKLNVQYSLSYPPVVLLILAVIFALRPTGMALVCVIVMPLVFTAFIGLLGLVTNLKHPNFSWTNEAQPVKNGMPVMITMFGGWGAVIVPAVLLFVLGAVPSWIIGAVFTAIILAADIVMYKWLAGKGSEIFGAL